MEFYEDSVIPNSLYDPITHTFIDVDGSTALETWGWFDTENDYVFSYTNYVLIVKSESGDYYKFWPNSYYSEYGESGYITFFCNSFAIRLYKSSSISLRFKAAKSLSLSNI